MRQASQQESTQKISREAAVPEFSESRLDFGDEPRPSRAGDEQSRQVSSGGVADLQLSKTSGSEAPRAPEADPTSTRTYCKQSADRQAWRSQNRSPTVAGKRRSIVRAIKIEIPAANT